MSATYEENLAVILRTTAEHIERFQAEIAWGQANNETEFVNLYKELASNSAELIENLLDAHFEALRDELPQT